MELPKMPDLTEEIKAEKDPNRRGILKVLLYGFLVAVAISGTFIKLYISSSRKAGEDCQTEVLRLAVINDSLQKSNRRAYQKNDALQAQKDNLQDIIHRKDSIILAAAVASYQSIERRNEKTNKIIKIGQ